MPGHTVEHTVMLRCVRVSVCLSHSLGGCTVCPHRTAIGRETYRFATRHPANSGPSIWPDITSIAGFRIRERLYLFIKLIISLLRT